MPLSTGDTFPARHETQTCLGLSGWSWLNPPTTWTASDDRAEIITNPDTDFWVTTHYGFVRDTGHALLRPVPAHFRLRVTVDGRYQDQYDQAGLLLRLDDKNWIKTGIEYVDGHQQISAVVTRDVSDWNVVPLEAVAKSITPVTIEMERKHDTVTIRYGTDSETSDTLLRLAYFPPGIEAQAGVMCASPDGTGFAAGFSRLRLETP